MQPTTPARRERLKAVVGTSIQHQVAFCGPLGVGKTTAVRAASSTEVATTEAPWSVTSTIVGRGLPKRTTTVGIDYGEWHTEAGERVAIYGTPGQARFAEARSGALNKNTTIVLWLYGDTRSGIHEARDWLELLQEHEFHRKLTVVVTRLSEHNQDRLTEYRKLLDSFNGDIKLTTADPRKTDEVRAALRLALGMPEDVA